MLRLYDQPLDEHNLNNLLLLHPWDSCASFCTLLSKAFCRMLLIAVPLGSPLLLLLLLSVVSAAEALPRPLPFFPSAQKWGKAEKF